MAGELVWVCRASEHRAPNKRWRAVMTRPVPGGRPGDWARVQTWYAATPDELEGMAKQAGFRSFRLAA